MKMIRVLHVIGIMNRGGAETLIMNLYRNIDRNRIQFDFVVNSEADGVYDREIVELGGRIYHCPHYVGTNHFVYIRWWRNFFSEHKDVYDIVHGHLGSTAAIYLKEAKKQGIYTVAHCHNTYSEFSFRQWLYQIYSYRTRFIADYFLACSVQAGTDRYGEAITRSSRYKVFKNAIDTAVFSYDSKVRMDVRSQFGIEEDQLLVGHVGRFMTQKNHTFLLDIFKQILQKCPGSRLLLIGDGDLRMDMEKKAESLGIKDEVIFAGIRSDVDRLMQAMDVMLFPSLFEGLPLTLVEAQTSGLPCVITDTIPKDVILCEDLIESVSLQEASYVWAEKVISFAQDHCRCDHSERVRAKGFDIRENAKWLEEFYIEHGSR